MVWQMHHASVTNYNVTMAKYHKIIEKNSSQTLGPTHFCWNQSFVLDSNKHFALYFVAVSVLFKTLILVKKVIISPTIWLRKQALTWILRGWTSNRKAVYFDPICCLYPNDCVKSYFKYDFLWTNIFFVKSYMNYRWAVRLIVYPQDGTISSCKIKSKATHTDMYTQTDTHTSTGEGPLWKSIRRLMHVSITIVSNVSFF